MPSSASHSTAPAFQFYLHEWRSSRTVQRMSWQQRGMYLEMLLEQADKGGLPDCPRACAELLGGTADEWITEWPVLRRKFVDRRTRPRNGESDVRDPRDHDANRQIINLRMARVLKERREYKKKKETAGRNGGLSKARNKRGLAAITATAELKQNVAEPKQNVALHSISSPLISSDLPSLSSHTEPFDSFDVETPPADLGTRAGEFILRYKALYLRLRRVHYLGKPHFDFEEAKELVAVFNDPLLDKLAYVWLNTDHDFAEKGTRTLAKFRSMATWCQERLNEWESQHGPLEVAS